MVTRRWSESDEAKSSYVKELFSALAPRYNVMAGRPGRGRRLVRGDA
jgi:hypothetical protein